MPYSGLDVNPCSAFSISSNLPVVYETLAYQGYGFQNKSCLLERTPILIESHNYWIFICIYERPSIKGEEWIAIWK